MATRTLSPTGGNWSSTAAWVEGVVPTAADDCIATALSGNLTVTANAACRSLDFTNDGAVNYLGTFTINAGVTLSIGDATAGQANVALDLSAGMTVTLGNVATSAISFVSTSATQQTITTAGKTLGNITFNGAGGSWKLIDGLTIGSTATLTLTAGTFNTNGQTCSWGLFNSSNSNVRTLSLGASLITITGISIAWNISTASNLTFNYSTSRITFTGANAQMTGGAGARTFYDVVASGSGDFNVNMTSPTFHNFTRTGTAARTDTLTFSSSSTFTVSGTLTLTGNSLLNRLLFQSNQIGTARTISAAAISITNTDFADITGSGLTGNAAWTGTSLGDCLGNSNITFDTPATQTWNSTSGGNWSDSTKWTSRVPLPQDDVVINKVFIATQTITLDMPRLGKSIDFTGTTGSPVIAFASTGVISATIGNTSYGSLTLAAGLGNVFQIGINYTLAGRSSYTITSAGKAWAGSASLLFNAPGGTYTLQDDLNLSTSRAIVLNFGTIDANGKNIIIGSFTSTTVSGTRAITFGSGTWTIGAPSGGATIWSVISTGLTTTPGTAIIDITATPSSVMTFAGGGVSYPTLRFKTANSNSLTITGNNTFVGLDIETNGFVKTLTLPASGTQTVTGTVTLQGASGKQLTIVSSTPGTYSKITITGSTPGSAPFATISDLDASGGKYIDAHNGGVNGSHNLNVVFLILSPAGIVSAQAFGIPKQQRKLTPAGITSAQAFGAPKYQAIFKATGIVSVQAFGTAKQRRILIPTGIVSIQAFGIPKQRLTLTAVGGITSETSFGIPKQKWIIKLSSIGIGSSTAFGIAKVKLVLKITGILSQEAFGQLHRYRLLKPASILSAETFGLARAGLRNDSHLITTPAYYDPITETLLEDRGRLVETELETPRITEVTE